MSSPFMAAMVGQFLMGHFPTDVYLYHFGHLLSPLCVGCGVLDMREHLLMDCTVGPSIGATLRVASECVCSSHGGGRVSPHLGVGLPRGHFRGSTLAGLFPCGCDTSMEDA